MSDMNDAFDILNEELSRHDLEQENARHLEAVRRRQAAAQQSSRQSAPPAGRLPEEDFFEDDEDEEKRSGCAGNAFRVIVILLLAGALAWMIFMPAGSLGELWGKLGDSLSGAFEWAVGAAGVRQGGGHAGEDADGGDYADEAADGDPDAAETARQSTGGNDAADGGETNAEHSADDYRITVYRPSQIVIVYDSAGNPAKVFSCSSGKSSTPTKTGDYAIRAKYRWRYMIGDCYTQYASSFSNGYLFHSIPYNKKNAATMSNSSYDKLGNPASSGCVRLCFRDTKWIYDNCPIGTKVSVVDENAPAGTVPDIIPERIKDKAHSGWDPTDDDPDSPYNR